MGCSESTSPPVDENTPPTISWAFDKLAVGVTTDNTLAVAVDDEDDDVVSVAWTTSAGLLNGAQGNPTMSWTAPSTREAVTITATASDGKGGTSAVTETIKTGTRKTNNFTGNTTWTLANSPYLLEPSGFNTTIINTASLTIEAGVEVFVKPDIDLQVEGSLVATGVPPQVIVIKPNTRTLAPGRWLGITGNPNSSVPNIDLEYVEISHAEKAVFATFTTVVSLVHCTITFSLKPAVHHQSSGSLTVHDCIITNNQQSGIQVDGSNLPATVSIQRDSIAFNGRFKDSTDYAEGEAGISINLFDPNGAVPIQIRDNEISRNDFPAIRLGDPKNLANRAIFPVISGNGIFGNEFRKDGTKVQIRLERPFSGVPTSIDGRNNFWGDAYPALSDSLFIKQGIVDQDDNPALIQVRVIVNPWLNIFP